MRDETCLLSSIHQNSGHKNNHSFSTEYHDTFTDSIYYAQVRKWKSNLISPIVIHFEASRCNNVLVAEILSCTSEVLLSSEFFRRMLHIRSQRGYGMSIGECNGTLIKIEVIVQLRRSIGLPRKFIFGKIAVTYHCPGVVSKPCLSMHTKSNHFKV